MAKFDITPKLRFCSRSEWSPNPAHPRLGQRVTRDRRTHVFIHHTCGVDSDDSKNIWENEAEIFATMKRLQTARGADLGNDVPYNFVAFMTTINDGLYICEGRGEDRSGAHTSGHNTKAIAVSFAGDFETQVTPDAEIAKRMEPLSNFLGWLRFDPSHEDYGTFRAMENLGSLKPQGRNVFFHRDVKATDCPGSDLMRHLGEVKFTRP